MQVVVIRLHQGTGNNDFIFMAGSPGLARQSLGYNDMANETVAKITCAWCKGNADVRRAKTGKQKMYVMCPNCGQQWLNLAGGQQIIEERAKTVAKNPIPNVDDIDVIDIEPEAGTRATPSTKHVEPPEATPASEPAKPKEKKSYTII